MENTTISEMRQSFQDGVDSIYNAIVGQGTTPSGKTPAQIVAAVGTLATNKYSAGVAAGAFGVVSVGGADSSGSFTVYNDKYRNLAYLIVDVVDDDNRFPPSIATPGGTFTELHYLPYGSHSHCCNAKVYQLSGVPAGNITVTDNFGYGRFGVLIG